MESDTITFLRTILPDQGLYAAVFLRGDKRRQIACTTIEELATEIALGDQQGWESYHACATYKERWVRNDKLQKYEFRTHANVFGLRSLFVDLDVGNDPRKYASVEEAYSALCTFVGAAGLGMPIVVFSGGGLHCYWPLAKTLNFQEWTSLAREFKRLGAAHGLRADPSRTADASSILRTPGTHNRKGGRNELVRLQSVQSNGLPKLQRGDYRDPEQNVGISPLHTSPYPERRSTRKPVLDNLQSLGLVGARFDLIAAGCAQLAKFRSSGNLSEPEWHAGLGVVVHCADGENLAHSLSADAYPRYAHVVSEEDWNRRRHERMDRLKNFGPTTCAKFHSLSPHECEHCPHFGHLTSPIGLGYGSGDAPASVRANPASDIGNVYRDVQTAELSENVGSGETGHGLGVQELPSLPSPFAWSNTGQLLFSTEEPNGQKINTVVCQNPIFLSGVQRAEVERENFSYVFKRLLPHEGWESLVIPAKELQGPGGLASMHGKGVNIHQPKMFMEYVRAAVDDYNSKHPTKTRFEQFGWKNEDTDHPSFFFGRYLYTSAGPVEVSGSDEVEKRVQYLGPRKGGSIHVWTEAVDTLFAKQMEAFGAVVVSSFAAVLLRHLSALEGGAWIHLFTPNSGKGKSTALQGAWTVWGTRLGTSLSEWDTKVGKFTTLGVMSNIPVIYDEINSRDPEALRDFIMIFSEGRDRIRGKSTGGTTFQKSSWSTVGLSGSNNSVLEQLPGSSGNDAAGFRVLELICELADHDRGRGDRLKDMMEQNAGFAGDVFIRYLMAPGVMPWAKEALEHWCKQLWQITKLPDEHRFRIRLVAAIAVAGTIVSKLELLHFNQQRIIDYLIEELKKPHNSGSVSGVDLPTRAVGSLGDFINAHQGEILQVVGPWRPKQAPVPPLNRVNGRISMRAERSSHRLYVSESVFKDWCSKQGLSPRVLYGALEAQGILLSTGKGRTLTAGTDLPGAQVHCLEINLEHPRMGSLLAVVAAPAAQEVGASTPVPLRPA